MGKPAKHTPRTHARAGVPAVPTQTIFCGDNLAGLRRVPDGCVDLVYIDPPFNSNRDFETYWGEAREKRSFEDRHESTRAYIDFLRPRCAELARALKPTGSYYHHCDWHASHHVRVLLDQVFGADGFRSEIIWRRTNAKGLAFRGFANNHDTILYYTASADFTWNRPFTGHDPEYVARFYNHVEAGTGRRYTLSDLTNPNPDRPNLTYEWNGITRVWRWTRERMERAERAGLLHYTASGLPRHKRYLDEMKGQPVDTLWTDIPPLQAHSGERVGYPTQKPLALLERIVRASSNPGDVVLDAFCGCGTALVAAQQAGRSWIGIDVSPAACQIVADRLGRDCYLQKGKDFAVRDLPCVK
jgi:site-specific DNA-methyltransferase (adenine-specific)